MSVPMPPTDNLYKFMAIGGLALALAANIFLWVTTRELLARALEFAPSVAALRAERVNLDGMLSELQTADGSKGKGQQEAAQRRWQDYRKLRDEHSVKSAEMNARGDVLRKMQADFERLIYVGFAATVIGLVSAVAGFILWYRKVQRYQDRVLRKQSESR